MKFTKTLWQGIKIGIAIVLVGLAGSIIGWLLGLLTPSLGAVGTIIIGIVSFVIYLWLLGWAFMKYKKLIF